MSESMYWGIFGLSGLFLCFLFLAVRRAIYLRAKTTARELLQHERLGALAKGVERLAVDPEAGSEDSLGVRLGARLGAVPARKVLSLIGIVLITGGTGIGLALHISGFSSLRESASFALVPICVGVGLIFYVIADRLRWME
jgi:hypothetical protein